MFFEEHEAKGRFSFILFLFYLYSSSLPFAFGREWHWAYTGHKTFTGLYLFYSFS
jgi:hypothetical protein